VSITRDDVARLIAASWAVVPIVGSRKNPTDADWLTRTYSPSDFGEDANVGVKCGSASAWRVDVDLDALEAVAAGQRLLPNTDCIHGRPGKPSSHHWYVCTGVKAFAFKDLDGEVLCEVRSDGGQTVVPPSTWTSRVDGHVETLAWVREGTPLVIAPEHFWHAVRAVAVASLFARHWPAGSRHYAAGHFAGLLLRLGYDAQWVPQIVGAAATIAKDEEVEDRLRIARDTCAKHARGEKTSGGPKLAELFGRGDDLLKRVYDWFGLEGAELLDQLNATHFIAQYGSDTVVGTEVSQDTLEIQDFDSFRRRYYNRRVGKHKLGEWWLTHPEQRRFRRITFSPPPLVCHPEDYNTWRGFAVAPDPKPDPEQRCLRFLDHLFRIVCNGNQGWFEYLLDVCALTCQFPGTPTGVAVVLQGDQAAGKGSFVDSFGQLFGVHYIQVDKQDHVTGRFNRHLANKVLLFADEAVWAGNKQDAGALKRLVTERTLTIERKFMDAVSEPNCLHLFMATNERWVWPAGMHERRGFILKVPKVPWATQDYFDLFHHEWAHGGNAAFLAVCLQRQVPRNKLGPIPRTDGLVEQQQISLSPFHQWWMDKLVTGDAGGDGGWPTFLSTEWCRDDFYSRSRFNQHTQMSLQSFAWELKALLPEGAYRAKHLCRLNVSPDPKNPILVTARRWGITLPALGACRAAFDRKMGFTQNWDPLDEDPELPLSEEDDDAQA
jgi:hypothetical protein